jgi:hypothetical protein
MNEKTKISFPKQTEILTCEELGIPDAPGVTFEFWKNPSKGVVTTISDVIMASADQLLSMDRMSMQDLEKRYYLALCELIIDCNVESINFDTPENAMKSFEAPDVPMGFMLQVIASYMARLIQFNDTVKKALALYLPGSVFGRGSAKKEEK